jgi:hypothetical protein
MLLRDSFKMINVFWRTNEAHVIICSLKYRFFSVALIMCVHVS